MNKEIVEQEQEAEVVVETTPHHEAQLQQLKEELQAYKDKERQNTINSITKEIDEIQSPIVKKLLDNAKDPEKLYKELLQENIIKKRIKKVVVEQKPPININKPIVETISPRKKFLDKIRKQYGENK